MGEVSYLDPGEEDDDRSHVVELDLQVGQGLETGVGTVLLQQAFETTANHGCSGYVHDDGNNTQLEKEQTQQTVRLIQLQLCYFNNITYTLDTHHQNENIQTVPQALEVMQPVDADLQHLLHHVVQDEDAERHLTHGHKVVPAGHVTHQTHCLELPGGHHPPGGRELRQQSDKSTGIYEPSVFIQS